MTGTGIYEVTLREVKRAQERIGETAHIVSNRVKWTYERCLTTDEKKSYVEKVNNSAKRAEEHAYIPRVEAFIDEIELSISVPDSDRSIEQRRQETDWYRERRAKSEYLATAINDLEYIRAVKKLYQDGVPSEDELEQLERPRDTPFTDWEDEQLLAGGETQSIHVTPAYKRSNHFVSGDTWKV